MRPPDLMHTSWRCDGCGSVPPLHVPAHIGPAVLAGAVTEVNRHHEQVPIWCPWPAPAGWTVTGVGWVSDEREGVRGTVLAASGPSPLTGGPADLLLIAEAPGTGLANRFADLGGMDPGPLLARVMADQPAHAKLKAGGHPTPMWSVPSAAGRSAYAGEAWGVWLVAVAWPVTAGYLLADDLVLVNVCDWLPPEMVYGAATARLPR